MSRSTPRVLSVTSAAMMLLVVSQQGLMAQTEILKIHDDTLTTSVLTATPVQKLLPAVGQRGTFVDGSVRAGPLFQMAISGNPGGGVGWSGRARSCGLSLGTAEYMVEDVDIALPAPGYSGWVVGRTYSSAQGPSGADNSNGYMGYNWASAQMELVLKLDGVDATKDMIYLVYGADRFIEFKRTGESDDTFRGVNGATGMILYEDEAAEGEPETYTYYDGVGTQFIFFGFDGDAAPAEGQLWKIVDPAGNMAYVGNDTTKSTAITSGYDANGRITFAMDGAGRAYGYFYSASAIGSAVRLEQVLCDDDGNATFGDGGTIMQVDYTYYTSPSSYGLEGDLESVTITRLMSDATSSVRKKHYRYWTDATYHATNNAGHAHELAYIIEDEGYRRADLELDSMDLTFDDTPLSEATVNLAPYANVRIGYDDTTGEVITVSTNGGCGCGGGSGAGEYGIKYQDNPNFSGSGGYDTAWLSRVIVARPDGAYEVQYFDETGQPLSHVMADDDPDTASNFWVTEAIRNADGCITAIRTPEANATYTHNDMTPAPSGAITAESGAGLITLFTRVSSGATENFVEFVKHEIGTGGDDKFDSKTTYTTSSRTVGSTSYHRAFVNTTRRYHVEQHTNADDTSSFDVTTTTPTFWAGDAVLMPKTITVTQPIVEDTENGADSAHETVRYMRTDGTTAFTQDEADIFNYMLYDDGVMVMSVRDVKTNDTTDIDTANDDPNTVWGITESGDGWHVKTVRTYDTQGRVIDTMLPDGKVTRVHRTVLADHRLVTLGFPNVDLGSPDEYFGPVSYTVSNLAGKPEFSARIFYDGLTETGVDEYDLVDETASDPIEALDALGPMIDPTPEEHLLGISVNLYNETGQILNESRVYTDNPIALPGTAVTNYDSTTYGYDSSYRRVRTTSPAGTISRTNYDAIGRYASSEIGTNDNGDDGSALMSGTNNMVKTSEVVYDSGAVGGNSLVTTRTAYVVDGASGKRDTTVKHDARGRAVITISPDAPDAVVKLDNLGRTLAVGTFSDASGFAVTADPTSTTTGRLSLSETDYDPLGRPWKSTRHGVVQDTGALSESIVSDNTWDPQGRLVFSDGEQLVKTAYDRLSRPTTRYTLAKVYDAGYDTTGYADAASVAGDIVAEQTTSVYESTDSNNVVATYTIARHAGDLDTGGSGTTGSLDDNGDGNAAVLTDEDVTGRVSITAMWYDDLDRLTTTASYGTYDIVGDATDNSVSFTRPGSPPGASNPVQLVTKTQYNPSGTVLQTTNADNVVTRMIYDDAGRVFQRIANYTNNPPGDANDIHTTTIYENGLRILEITDLDAGGDIDAGEPYTRFIYGTTKGAAPLSAIATNHLLRATRRADSTNGATTGAAIDSDNSDVMSYSYNVQGEVIQMKDPNGTVHDYTRDLAGRVTIDVASTLGTDVDGQGTNVDSAVRRHETTYDSRGMVATLSRYAATSGGSPLSQEEFTYDKWGMLELYEQDHDSAVGASGVDEYSIGYEWELATPTGGRRTLRLYDITYPDGSSVAPFYSSASDRFDDAVSRVTVVARNTSSIKAIYDAYMGAGSVTRTDLFNDTYRDLRGTSPTAAVYPSLDRYNRIVEDTWTKDPASNPDFHFYNTEIAYSGTYFGRIEFVEDKVHNPFGVQYTTDNLCRVTNFTRGTVSIAVDSLTLPTGILDYDYDQAGNFDFDRDLDGDGNYTSSDEFEDARTFNNANELVGIDRDFDETAPPDETYTLVYDKNGNLTDDDNQREYVFDAWNNVVRVNDQGGDPISYYWYNTKGQRIAWQDDADADTTIDADEKYHIVLDMYGRTAATIRHEDTYNPGGGAVHAFKELFLYHMPGLNGSGYTDNILLRLRDNSNGWTGAGDGTLEEEIYYHTNSRGEMVALTDVSGRLVEQVRYTPEGRPFNLPTGDANSDGHIDYAGDYDAMATGDDTVAEDSDLDGDVDGDDASYTFSRYGLTYTGGGDGVLSDDGIGNRRATKGRDQDTASTELDFSRGHYLLDRELIRSVSGGLAGRYLMSGNTCSPICGNYGSATATDTSCQPEDDPIDWRDCSEIHDDFSFCMLCCIGNGGGGECINLCEKTIKPNPSHDPSTSEPCKIACDRARKTGVNPGAMVACDGKGNIITCTCNPLNIHPGISNANECQLKHEYVNAGIRSCEGVGPGGEPRVLVDTINDFCNEAAAYMIAAACVANKQCGGESGSYENCMCEAARDSLVVEYGCRAVFNLNFCLDPTLIPEDQDSLNRQQLIHYGGCGVTASNIRKSKEKACESKKKKK